jgi:hypothetical protein
MSTQITTQVFRDSMSWGRRGTFRSYLHVGQLKKSIVEIKLLIDFAFERNLIKELLRQDADMVVGFILDRPKIFTMLAGGN